ncbi:DUF5365 family protein [Siminovitchia sp. FSL H7-0308]|uniref:Uncharacterized protein n=1 Tax=Siminovitchia thermophila TaxID=1245522 RepID=A0ABS2R637_9BACI|nr:DUF5365 family protein [Siminovitchia thermophila]MBM7715122.1 hypothetical protein [Siminovitchia thermophila]ONK22801.1 hypothetical protein BLX87_13855 [Bacillus sp. VT-16-64]
MKVVFAATQEQKETISSLLDDFYSSILPSYFQDDDIYTFCELNILKTPSFEDWPNSASDALNVIAALQVMKTLLELRNIDSHNPHLESIFYKNKKILESHDISFPFTYSQYTRQKGLSHSLSIFTPAYNDFLI